MSTAFSIPKNILLVAAAALIDGEGRVLVQRRPNGSDFAGLWEFPGGKLEPGETPEATLNRELSEELSIDVDATDLSPAGFASAATGDRHLLLLLYICRRWRGVPRAVQAAELRWLNPAQLHMLPMPPADRPLLKLLEALL